MKRIFTVLLLGAIVAASGCNKSKDTAGGPGASKPAAEQPKVGQTEDSFSLDTPMMSTKMAQGEDKALTIGIKRGKNFDQDVTLNFNDLPKGVTIYPPNPVIKHGDAETTVTLKTMADASLGDFTVKVMGRPAKGRDATSDLKITVVTT